MFLDVLRRRNPAFIEAAIGLHQQGKLPANAYVLDLDAVERNAKVLKQEADRLGLNIFAMTKQVGRSSSFCKAVVRGGIERAVAVDMACARATHKAGMKLGHLGHLQQIAKFEADAAARTFKPDYWTAFNDTKAEEAGKGAKAAGYVQDLLARIAAEGDIFYRGHEGGFDAGEIVAVADRLDAVPGGRFAGITTFPALLFDHAARKVLPTPNLATLSKAAEALAKAGRKGVEINAPGTTSSVMLAALAEAGATQCEPGNGLHGTTALHVMEDLPELPAVLYLTEVSHLSGGKAYCFGGGFYIDPIFPDYDVK
ncbi:YhfX family PLP-dependent enzyme, partial [Mesorhizobium sp. M00.F.Ca.ET.038.03.1.1]